MNRYKYSSMNPAYMSLNVGEILKHRFARDVFGFIESISPNIRVVYGMPVDGSFIRGSEIEKDMVEDWIEFDDVEDLAYTFYVPRVY